MTNPDQQHAAQETQKEALSREPESPEEELARISESLGPFRPPSDFDLGEEFLVPPPRPIPSNLLKGTYRRRWTLITRIYVALGGLCIVLGHTDTVQSLGFYVLVLGYLRYIGWGLLAIAGLRVIIGYARPGPYKFVRDGVATIGRVLAVRKRYLHGGDGGLKQFHFSVATEFRPPSNTELCRATLESERIVPLGSPDKYTTTLRPGDYVTVVGMPNRFEQSARIYGFLGVNPNNEYVLRNGAATLNSPATSLLLALAGVIVLMFVAPVFLFGMDKYAVTGGADLPWVIGTMLGAVLGSVALTLAYLQFSDTQRGFKQAATAALSGLMLGAIGGFFSTSIINGVFDRSPPVYVEIEAEQYWQETFYPFFIRKYELEFRCRPGQQTKKHMTTPEVLAGFMGTGTGIAEYGQGAFGMTWLRQLFPTELVPLLDGDPEELVVLAFDTEEEDGTITRTTLKPVINLADGSTYQPSKRMIQRIRELLTEE